MARRSQARRRAPSSTAANASITLPVAAVATALASVVHSDRVAGMAAYAAPRKNSSSATPLTSVTTTRIGSEPWSAKSRTLLTCSSSGSICAHDQATDDEDAASASPRAPGSATGRPTGRGRRCAQVHTARTRAHRRPDRREGRASRGRTRRCRARSQREPSTTHPHTKPIVTACADERAGDPLVASDDVPQRALQPACGGATPCRRLSGEAVLDALEAFLDLTGTLLHRGLGLVGLALGLELVVAGHLADALLGLAAEVVDLVAGLVVESHSDLLVVGEHVRRWQRYPITRRSAPRRRCRRGGSRVRR